MVYPVLSRVLTRHGVGGLSALIGLDELEGPVFPLIYDC